MTKQEIKDKVEEMFKPTIDNAIRDMRYSKMLYLTKDNKYYSSIANEYMEDKKKFLPFIIEKKQKEFITQYTQIFQEVGTEPDEFIAYRLLNWQHSGEMMMLLNANTNWDLVDTTIHEQGHTGGTMSCLASKVLYFSPYGLDFIEHVYGPEERERVEKEINKV